MSEQPQDNISTALKVPPQSIEAERSVLGGLMLDDQSWFDLVELVKPSDFYRTQHQIIFEAMMVIENKDQPLDAVTLSEELQNQGQLEKVGGVGYLADIADSTPGATNVLAWARIVRERSILRQLIGAANNIADSAFNPDGRESDLLLELAEQSVFQISENRLNDGGPEKIGPALLQSAVEKVQFLFANKGSITGVPSGFKDLDKKTTGFQDSDLVIVAGRPSMGKSALAINFVEHAIMSDRAVLVFSLEMPSEQIVMRLLSSLGRIDQNRLRTGELFDEDWTRFTGAVSHLSE